ncbi:hypothetical protein PMG11_09763 [Penicillium brasilianum]|uniref:Prion-inhibition and propagation HeLo domain-containing protein n=1 Tax=Penicillium brasilianum TaxID=104259 RepID=A0A0F7TZ59_PENBI|nr:hypothetical protein PMG11_09763 [Penicillium brasilianum]
MASQSSISGATIPQLWEDSIKEYEKATGKSLRLGKFKTMDEIMSGTEGLSSKFKDFRSDESKVTKVRTALKNNMWLIQKVVNTVQSVGNAASAFPPAMPANLIFTAFGQVMQSFADVSADYDKVMGFFEFTHRFFDRLSMIEQKMPDLPPFQRCVSRVFSSILKICAISQQYCAEKRFKKWFDNLMNGTDGELAGASAELEGAINEMSEAVGLATLRTVEILDEVVQSMNGNVEFLVSNATLIEERTAAIETNTNTILEQNQNIASRQGEMSEMQRETLAQMREQSRMLNGVVQLFGSVQMGEGFSNSFKTSLLKVDVIRLRLTRWGQSVGLANFADLESLQQTKLSPEDIPRVEELLGGIMDQFSDAETYAKRFKRKSPGTSTLDPAKELDTVSASLHQQMSEVTKRRQGDAEQDAADHVAFYEEKYFVRLIEDTSTLVDDLIELFPAVQAVQRKLCEEEVAEMNKIKDALPLLKEVAAGQDKMLSDTVVKVIESSTTYNNSVIFSGTNSGFQIGNNKGRISNVRFG